MIIIEIIKGFGQAFSQLLPKEHETTTRWISKLITLTLIGAIVFAGLFFTIRDTDLGREIGFNTYQEKRVTNLEYRNIFANIYVKLLRAKEDFPLFRSIYFVAVFDESGEINFADENYDRIGIMVWYRQSADYINFNTLEEVIQIEKRRYIRELGVQKTCIVQEITFLQQQRYRQAVPTFNADRVLLCPVPGKLDSDPVDAIRLPFGGIVAFWTHDSKVPSETEMQQAIEVGEVTSVDIGHYLRSQEDLKLNQ